MKLISSLVGLVCVVSFASVVQGRTANFCTVGDLPLSPTMAAPAHFSEHLFASKESSLGTLTFHNGGSSEAAALTVVVDYLDSAGHVLVTIVYGGAVKDGGGSLQWPIVTEYRNMLPRPIEVGGSIRLQGISPFTTTDCPVSSTITFLDIEYVNGTAYKWSSQSWRAEPILLECPDDLVVPDNLSRIGDATVLVSLDTQGRVAEAQLHGEAPKEATESVEVAVRHWRFAPALRNGSPVGTQFTLVLHFFHFPLPKDSEQWLEAYHHKEPRRFVVVLLKPRLPQNGQWAVFYGASSGACVTRRELRRR